MKTHRLLGALCAALVVAGCAGAGVAPGSPDKGYVVWGYVGTSSTQAAANQTVTLLDPAGTPVAQTQSDAMGKYVFAYYQPGQYVVQVGQLQMPLVIAAADQRLDIDLSNPTGTMNYAQQPKPPPGQSKGKGGQPASSGNPGEPSEADLDTAPPGTNDCWAAAGCGGYDAEHGTYMDETGAPQ